MEDRQSDTLHSVPAPLPTRDTRVTRVYAMAILCLLVGLPIGYLLRMSQAPTAAAESKAVAAGSVTGSGVRTAAPIVAGRMNATNLRQSVPAGGHMPSLEQMKQTADRQAGPLLQKLQSDPKNTGLLAQIGGVYHGDHQFKEASIYYGRAVQADPKNVALRIKLATSLYRSADIDGALTQLNQALSIEPNDANALFDLGMIKLQGKQDGKGALAAWQRLLKTNPQLSEERKSAVQKLMAQVTTTLSEQGGAEGARSNGARKSNLP